MKIIRMRRSDRKFYTTLGPFLSRRAIVRELGSPVWDDDGKVWFVAKDGRRILGFAALRKIGNHTALASAYVLPEHRGKRVYDALIKARLSQTSGTVRAVVTKAAAGSFRRHGFKPVAKRGRFTVMEKYVG